MAAHSPASSPRLPSPPPIAEDQLGPASPGVALFEDNGKLLSGSLDQGAQRRIRPGTKAEDMAEGPPLVELQDIDSPFPLTEHLKSLHHSYTHPASHKVYKANILALSNAGSRVGTVNTLTLVGDFLAVMSKTFLGECCAGIPSVLSPVYS